jgi:hypothetical protein
VLVGVRSLPRVSYKIIRLGILADVSSVPKLLFYISLRESGITQENIIRLDISI